MAYVDYGLRGLGDAFADAKAEIDNVLKTHPHISSFLDALPNRWMQGIKVSPDFHDNTIPALAEWVRARANAPNADPNWSLAFQAIGANFQSHARASNVDLVMYSNTFGGTPDALLNALTNAALGMVTDAIRQNQQAVRNAVSNLFHSIFSGLSTIPQADVDWGTTQILNNGWSMQQLTDHWNTMAVSFGQILAAVPWYTNQDDIYGIWGSKNWDVGQAINAITAAHPKPASPAGGGGGGGGGTGTGAGSPLTVAGMDLSFLKSPLVWIGIAVAGGLYYWLSVRKEPLTDIPYVGPYIGKASRAVGMKKKRR